MAGPRRPSDGKNRWVTETNADALRETEITESSGSVSMTKGEAVSRLAVRLSTTPNRGTIPAVLDG